MTASPSVNVISKDYAYGLRHSRALITAALESTGLRVRTLGAEDWRTRIGRRFHCRSRSRDFNVFLEEFYPTLYPMARRQILIPNQEWFPEHQVEHLKKADLVICKTRHAQQIFIDLGASTSYSSFTSRDRRQTARRPMQREFLCLSGNQVSVDGNLVLTLWARHPEWPRLTITSDGSLPRVSSPNVRQIGGFLTDDAIGRLQNEHLFHLCVSRAEGFGHKLNEGMSCGAIVIATDGPPMNELITPERGMLVRFARSEPLGLGTAFDFDEVDLEATVEKCLRLSTAEIERMSQRARSWYDENDRFFRATFPQILREM
jgi:hypothetical protein